MSRALGGAAVLWRRAAAALAISVAFAAAPGTAGAAESGPGVDAYQGSWTQRALALQYDLAGDVGLRNAPWVGTHNSYNSTAEMGQTLSNMDSNQKLSIVDQLRIDVRSLELDVHWFPSPSEGGFAPVVCHATEQHAGCSVEKPLRVVLAEIAGWLRDNRDQVLLLYLEDHLDHREGHDAAAAAIETELGDLVYRPPAGGGCTALPLDLTRDQVLAAGGNAILVSGCGVGAAWRGVVFDWSAHVEARPRGYKDFPDCGPDFDRATYDSRLVRYFEDSTRLTNGASTVGAATRDDGITPETAARMARCGVDLTGMDQLLPGDGRLDALVWSWAPGEPRPAGGDCAVQNAGARWEARSCRERHRVACRAGDGSWLVPKKAVRADDAASQCADAGATHAAPRTGYEGQLLRVAMEGAGARDAWLGYRATGGTWQPLDQR